MSEEEREEADRAGGERVLVVDDDPDIARFVEVNLRTYGYEVYVASDGLEALDKAHDLRPELILLDVMMPNLDGFEVAQRLRSDPRTRNVSIIMLTAKAMSADKVLGLTAGADDYIIKPFDPIELVARVKGVLRRAREMKSMSPLTGLPGNLRIQDEIHRRVQAEAPFALLYADLDNFKAYNDHYGFLRGDNAIQLTARVLQDVVTDMVGEDAFVGHVGGDDFTAICPPDVAEGLCEAIVERFDREVATLYDPADYQQGYVEVVNRKGESQRFPILSISIGVATTARRKFTHREEAVAVATELKEYAKRSEGSSWAIDRRTA
ncbi:MAG TPA: response regulator [Actinomycetota bacterium]|nr:response regulator [Actinomycetota bacterium]